MTICVDADVADVSGGRSRLSRLADAAIRIARNHSGAIALVRGFDRESRHQAAALRNTMAQRGVRAFELTPGDVVDSAHRRRTGVAAVVDLTAPDRWDARRLAAHLAVPLITLADGARSFDLSMAAGPVLVEHSYDAIGLFADRYEDVALSRVTVASCDPEPAVLELLLGGHDPIRLENTEISVRLRSQFLEIGTTTPGGPSRHFRGPRCALRALTGRFVVVRDGTPTADLHGALSITVWPRGTVRNPDPHEEQHCTPPPAPATAP